MQKKKRLERNGHRNGEKIGGGVWRELIVSRATCYRWDR